MIPQPGFAGLNEVLNLSIMLDISTEALILEMVTMALLGLKQGSGENVMMYKHHQALR